MMGWGGTWGAMMAGGSGFYFLTYLIQIVLLIDLILLMVWLWQKIRK